MPHQLDRWMYRGGRPNRVARFLNGIWRRMAAAGLAPQRLNALEVRGRLSGRRTSFPVVVADHEGERYLVAMLGEHVNWVANVRAAGGQAVLRHGRRSEPVRLEEVDPGARAPISSATWSSHRGPAPTSQWTHGLLSRSSNGSLHSTPCSASGRIRPARTTGPPPASPELTGRPWRLLRATSERLRPRDRGTCPGRAARVSLRSQLAPASVGQERQPRKAVTRACSGVVPRRASASRAECCPVCKGAATRTGPSPVCGS
jgi:hypothetical protein